MTVSKLKFATTAALLAGGLAASSVANAGITLPVQGLKTKAVLTFTVSAYGSAQAANIQFGALGNAVRLPDVGIPDPDDSSIIDYVASFDFPVTKANISIGWDLKIHANYGDSVRSALQLKRGSRQLTLANFNVNFNDKVLYADFIKSATETSLKQPLYTFVETSPQKVSFANLVLNMTVKIGNLMLPESAQNALGDALSLSDPLRATLKDQKWGEIDIQVTSYKRTPALNTTPFTGADLPQ